MTGRAAALAQPSARPAGRRRERLLWASLGVNVFLIALTLARVLHVGLPGAGAPAHQAPIARIIAALPPDDAARFRATLVARRAEILPAREAVSVAQARLAEAIRGAPFDAPAVAAALANWQDRWQHFVMTFNSAVLAGLATLSYDGRARFADASLAEDARHAAAAAQAYTPPGH